MKKEIDDSFVTAWGQVTLKTDASGSRLKDFNFRQFMAKFMYEPIFSNFEETFKSALEKQLEGYMPNHLRKYVKYEIIQDKSNVSIVPKNVFTIFLMMGKIQYALDKIPELYYDKERYEDNKFLVYYFRDENNEGFNFIRKEELAIKNIILNEDKKKD